MAFQTINPYTAEVVKTFENATPEQIDTAIAGAHEAFLSWKNEPVEKRAELLGRAAAELRANSRRYAEILTLEMGKLIDEAEAEVELSANILDYYAKFGPSHLTPRYLPADGFGDTDVALVNEPLGVLYAIEPWNFPFIRLFVSQHHS